MNIDMGYRISIWDTVYRCGYLPYRHGHPGYRYGIWANDMGDESIDTVILRIDMGYLVTLALPQGGVVQRRGDGEIQVKAVGQPRGETDQWGRQSIPIPVHIFLGPICPWPHF